MKLIPFMIKSGKVVNGFDTDSQPIVSESYTDLSRRLIRHTGRCSTP